MRKFKVGDKVERVTGPHGYVPIGKTLTVTLISHNYIKVEGCDRWLWGDYFRLVKEAPTECTFKPGKKYKTRDGRDVIVYAVYTDNPEYARIHGAYLDPLGMWVATWWYLDGSAGCRSAILDLVPNKRVVYLNVWTNASGNIGTSQRSTRDEACSIAKTSAERYGWKYHHVAMPIEIEEE